MATDDRSAQTQLVARLTRLASLSSVPEAQLDWLATRGDVQTFEAGSVLYEAGDAVKSLWLPLSGCVAITVDRGAGPRRADAWRAGDLSGLLPYSRLRVAPGRIVVEETADVLMLESRHFPEMIQECHELTDTCIHVMVDRARHFTSTDLREEKMLSLGKLAAGLAHELNNPASAATRSADELAQSVRDLETSAIALGAAGLPPAGFDAVARFRRAHLSTRGSAARSPLEQADWQDEIESWLDAHGLSETTADSLAESSVTLEALDALAAELTPDQLKTVVAWFVAAHSLRQLAGDVETATRRIYSLVTAVKGFTYMDQAAAPQTVEISQCLADTLTVLSSKGTAKDVTLELDVQPGLPAITGFGGELNQVWSNLIDNALDAAGRGGHVRVGACRHGEHVVVSVTDDGPGVPDDIKARIFDPFFTTKPPGSGTGLGLDIVRRLVHNHGGSVEMESSPGHTEFRVRLSAVDS